MAVASDRLVNINLFVDGIGYAGKCASVKLPNIETETEEFFAAGMISPLDVETGKLAKLEAEFTMNSIDTEILGRVGNWLKPVSLTLRGAIQDFDGNTQEVVVKMTGKIKKTDLGEWKPGENTQPKYTVSVYYYHFMKGGIPIYIVDVKNMVCVVNGVDLFADIRKALGIETSAASIGANVVGI